MEIKLDSVESAIEDIKNGKVIIVVDDENRENEGDFVTAARNVTPEIINFMATHGRGLVCAPLIESKCDELGLELMVNSNTAAYETPFTVSVDLVGHGCTTGISASDRSKTVQALIDPNIHPRELGKPGHIFPLRAKEGGVLRRMGHTEAATDLAKLAGFEPAGVIVEILNEDGTMARLPQLAEIAKRFDLKLISIEDLIAYRLENESLVEKKVEVTINTDFGDFNLIAYEQTTTNDIHLALTKGTWSDDEEVPVRVHSTTIAHDIFGAITHGNNTSISNAMEIISKEGKGLIVCMNQRRKNNNIINQLKAIKLRQEGNDDEAGSLEGQFQMDDKDYGVGAQIIRSLGVKKMKLITNSPRKTGQIGYGLEITEILNSVPAEKI